MRLIETAHLNMWADSKAAEASLPHLVKQLICAVIQPDKIRFPSGDAVWVPGYDGELVTAENNRFVPIGASVWEVSTEKDIRTKATKDYKKRSKDAVKGVPASRLERSETTFIFVTPRIWQKKDFWVSERQKEGIWKDVTVLDGVDLQDWLEAAPAVCLQFAAEVGLVPEAGLATPDQAWDEWSHFSLPPLSEEIVVVAREEQEKEFVNRLAGPPSTLTIRGDSPREAWGFALASLRRLTTSVDRTRLCSRIIIADDEHVAGRLRNRKNLIIVLKEAKGQVSGHLSTGGSHVVIPEGNDSRSERNVIALPRPTHRLFADTLRRIGLADEEAERAARACGRSVTILQRQYAHSNFERPKWADGPVDASLLAALLVGRWNRSNRHDQEILCKIANVHEYDDIEGQLQDFLWVEETPLQEIAEMWTLTAPVDAFQLTARSLTLGHLDRFKEAFRSVFGRLDPKVEIPPADWLYHDISGDHGHSAWLRAGMAETLLLIAERGADAGLVCVSSPRDYAADVIRGLPGLNDDWRILASLRDQCARLMEAAADPFLGCLEHLLQADRENLSRLFAEDTYLGAVPMHTGLLWGLESLAWSPHYLPRVALILAEMARIDPGGRFSNRPINSLREIFLWWHPGTNALPGRKLDVLDLILCREREVGWSLLALLLPSHGESISHPTARPRWIDFGDLPDVAREKHGQFNYLEAIVDRVLDNVGADQNRWKSVFEAFSWISRAQRERALSQLDDIAATQDVMVKIALWEETREFVNRGRVSGGWSAEMISRFENVLAKLAPVDPVARNRWLFEDWVPLLPFPTEDVHCRQRKLKDMRSQAVGEILSEEGTAGVARLGTMCAFPQFVATAVVAQVTNIDDLLSLIEESIASGDRGLTLASHISGEAMKAHGDMWSDLLLPKARSGIWSPAVVASLILWWPDGRETWQHAEDLGELVRTEYWVHKPILPLEDTKDWVYEIEQLIEVGRPSDVFGRITLFDTPVPSQVLLRVFDATVDQVIRVRGSEESADLAMSSHDICEFLDRMRDCNDIPREEVALREYRAELLFHPHRSHGLTIHKLLAEDPKLYVQILCDVFLPAHRDEGSKTSSMAEQLAFAQTGFRLLAGMDHIPGQSDDGQIDEAKLQSWIDSVRELAKEQDRSGIADDRIGTLLARSPADPDGGWPHRSVRNVIERLGSDTVDRGIMIERRNMRGVTTRDLYEGGSKESALAREYQDWGGLVGARWPRTERILIEIAQSWEDDARREDVLVEQYKMELE